MSTRRYARIQGLGTDGFCDLCTSRCLFGIVAGIVLGIVAVLIVTGS